MAFAEWCLLADGVITIGGYPVSSLTKVVAMRWRAERRRHCKNLYIK
jgi:hypothetical protein